MSEAKITGASKLSAGMLVFAFALAGPVMAIAPLGMAPLTIATGILTYLTERATSGSWPRLPQTAIGISILFLIWCAISLIWDLNPPDGARKLVDMVAIFLSVILLIGLARRLNTAQSRRAAMALIGGTVFGLGVLVIETTFDFPLYRAFIGPSPKLAGMVEAKRAIDALPILVWATALGLGRLRRPWLGVALTVAYTLLSFRMTASSATLAMVGSLAILALAWKWPIGTGRLLASGTILAFAVIVPLAIALNDLGGTTSPHLKRSAQHRVEIWNFAAEKTLDRPLFGHGLNSTRYIPNDGAVSAFQPPEASVITLHTHNGFLQVWLELGVVGVLLCAALLLAALSRLRDWPVAAQPFARGGYTAAMIVAGLAFGIWQSWWLATLGFGIVACAVITGDEHHA